MTALSNSKVSAWQMAADDILSAALNDHTCYEQARFGAGIDVADYPPGNWRGVWRTICMLKDAGSPLHDSLIMEHVPGLELSWLAQRLALDDGIRRAAFNENVGMLKRRGREYAVYEAMRIAQEELRSERTDIEAAVGRVLQAAALGNRTDSRETAESHIDEFVEYMNTSAAPAPMTGIAWLDSQTNGLQPGRAWVIGGAYKQRKTTLAINIALGILMRNPEASLSFLSFEMPRPAIIASICAMLSVYHYTHTGNALRDANIVSMDNLRNAREAYKRWNHGIPQSIEWSFRAYKHLKKRLRIYDVSHEGGGLSDLNSLQRTLLRDKALYGCQFAVIDHLQEVKSPGEIYERVSAVSGTITHLTKRENITTFTLSQLNEATVKSKSDDDHSPGAKGGGTPAEKADYFIRVRYMPDHPDQLGVKMQLSRYGAMGNDTKSFLPIHPSSGLLLDNQWGKVQ